MTKKIVQLDFIAYELSDFIQTGDTWADVRARIDALEAKSDQPDMRVFDRGIVDKRFEISYYGYDGGQNIELNLYREETDKEYADRLAEEERTRRKAEDRAKLKKDKEYAQYLKLKEKFKNEE